MSKVLNRPMFNSQNSAYGRGITSNLVTEEQRVKYNTGGRVGLAKGVGVFNFAPSDVENIKRLPGTEEIDYDFYEKEGLKVPTTWGEAAARTPASHYFSPSGTGYLNPGSWAYKLMGGKDPLKTFYGREEEEKLQFEKDRRAREIKEAAEGPGWGLTPRKEDIDITETDIKVGGKGDGVDLKSDTLDWTDQERKEKKGQIQLKLAQRLVGGARDPWGSAKQMKNVGDWLGDVAAIGDKTELRKEERKYQAWAKAKKDIARDVQASTLEYNNLRAAGVGEAKALDISTGGKIKARTITSSTNEKMRKKSLANVQKGDIIYDEDIQSFTLKDYVDSSGKHIPIEKEKLVEVQEDFLKKGA